jgi:hypothetical protein
LAISPNHILFWTFVSQKKLEFSEIFKRIISKNEPISTGSYYCIETQIFEISNCVQKVVGKLYKFVILLVRITRKLYTRSPTASYFLMFSFPCINNPGLWLLWGVSKWVIYGTEFYSDPPYRKKHCSTCLLGILIIINAICIEQKRCVTIFII